MPGKWMVVVVHGVGDTSPGNTVDNLLPALAVKNPKLTPIGAPETRFLEDPVPPAKKSNTLIDLFPVHVRHVAANALPADPQVGTFAEFYWADLSRIRDGFINLIIGLLSVVFLLGVIPRHAITLQHSSARCLRFLLDRVAWLIHGPIAASTVLLALFVGFDLFVLTPFENSMGLLVHTDDDDCRPQEEIRAIQEGERNRLRQADRRGILFFTAIVSILFWLARGYLRKHHWGYTWIRFSFFGLWISIGLAIAAGFTAYQQEQIWQAIPWVNNRLGDVGHNPVSTTFAAFLLLLIEVEFTLLVITMSFAFLAWLFALGYAYRRQPNSQAGLFMAYAAAWAQVGIWLLVVPPLAMILLDLTRRVPVLFRLYSEEILESVWTTFAVHLIFTALLGVSVWLLNRQRKTWGENYEKTAGETNFRTIPRLLGSPSILLGIVLMSLIASSIFQFAFWHDRPDQPRTFAQATLTEKKETSERAKTVEEWTAFSKALGALLVGLVPLIAALILSGIRDWLHIVMDVINHFYRRRDPIPWPWKENGAVHFQDYETRCYISFRLIRMLEDVLKDDAISHLTVISHSQGTMIVLDLLAALSYDDRFLLKKRIYDLKEFHLITMGCPFAHLYQHYFADQYPDLSNEKWSGFRSLFPATSKQNGRISKWVNIFRVDDFIGTFITPANYHGSPAIEEVPIAAGGHTDYWVQPAALAIMSQHLPGRPLGKHQSAPPAESSLERKS